MAYKKADLEKLATILKLDPAAFIAGWEATEEKDLTVPELSTFTADELAARDTQQKADGKREAGGEGKEIGKELIIKDLKKAFNLEFEGKDLTKLTEAIKTQFSKGDDGLKEQIKLLQTNLAAKETEIGSIKAEAELAKTDATLLSQLPKNRIGTFTDAEYLTLVKSALKFEAQDEKMVAVKDGQILRDPKTTNPLAVSDAINTYFAERKWTEAEEQVPGGRGGKSSSSTGKAMKMSEAVADWEAQGKNAASAEFNAHLKELSAANDNFDFYS